MSDQNRYALRYVRNWGIPVVLFFVILEMLFPPQGLPLTFGRIAYLITSTAAIGFGLTFYFGRKFWKQQQEDEN